MCRARADGGMGFITISVYLRLHSRVPAQIVGRPEFYPPHGGHWVQHVLVEVWGVQRVDELLLLTVHVRP